MTPVVLRNPGKLDVMEQRFKSSVHREISRCSARQDELVRMERPSSAPTMMKKQMKKGGRTERRESSRSHSATEERGKKSDLPQMPVVKRQTKPDQKDGKQ